MVNLTYKPFYLAASLIIICFFPSLSFAEVSIGYAQDVYHGAGTSAAVLRYDHAKTRLGGQAMYWEEDGGHTNYSIGIDYDVLASPTYDLNLGGVYINEVNDINGTHFNFSIGAGVNLWDRLRIQFTHFSNAHRKNNEGWNFIGVMLRL